MCGRNLYMSLAKKALITVKKRLSLAQTVVVAFIASIMGQLACAAPDAEWNPGGKTYTKHSAGSDAKELMGRGELLVQDAYRFGTVICTLIALILIGTGLYLFKSSEDDQQKKKKTAWICLGIGGCFAVITYILYTMANTVTGKG